MVKEISVNELDTLQKQHADIQLIDVREPHERQICNIGGELIPMGSVTENIDKISRDKQVVIYCRSGMRSANVVALLQDKYGFTNLVNLKGGVLAWSDMIDPKVQKY